MAGHSKWAKVKHFKGAIDAKRSRIFAKLSREISIATKIGGGEPSMNPRLRMVLLKCRSANMPSDNIERAIKKGLGGGGEAALEDLTYEIFGPHGVAFLVELTSDNRNRTSAEIRAILTRNAGTLATAGAVSRLFHRKGQLIIARDTAAEDQVMQVALESGAEDFKSEQEGYEIITDPQHFETVHRHLEKAGIRCEAAQITWLPDIWVEVNEPASALAVRRLEESLDEHEDVKEVYTNAALPQI